MKMVNVKYFSQINSCSEWSFVAWVLAARSRPLVTLWYGIFIRALIVLGMRAFCLVQSRWATFWEPKITLLRHSCKPAKRISRLSGSFRSQRAISLLLQFIILTVNFTVFLDSFVLFLKQTWRWVFFTVAYSFSSIQWHSDVRTSGF